MEESQSFIDDEATKAKEEIRATNEIEKYWKDCNRDARWIGIFATSVRIIGELRYIDWPLDQNETNRVEKYIVYISLSLVCLGFMLLSFKKKYGAKYCFFPIIISIVKIVWIVSDFDDLTSIMGTNAWNVTKFNCLGSGFVLFITM